MDINVLRQLHEMGRLSDAELEQAEQQNYLREVIMPERPDVPEMAPNTMRDERTGKVTSLDFGGPQAAAAQPKRGAPVEVVGRGRGHYSPDGRSVVFADGSTQDLHPKQTMKDFMDSFAVASAKQKIERGDLEARETQERITNAQLARQPKPREAPAGYRYKSDGSMERVPGGPADDRATEDARKKAASADDTLGLLAEAEKLLPLATESLVGTGVDALANAVGYATDGAKATAQLKAIQGQLVAKMPRMEGPQSNYDVRLYQEMAGQLSDSTIPMESRLAALQTIRKLNEKYATSQGQAAANPSALIQQAREAIRRGAPAAAVKQRLESMGVRDHGL